LQIKAADGRNEDVIALERLLDRPDVPSATRKRIEDEIAQIRSGEKAEHDAAYDIELYFGRSENWATIHDLRIEVDGLAAQIDHLIINRLAEIWVCESKAFTEGVSVDEHGEWVRWWNRRPTGIPSPIEQNHRQVHLLERVFDDGLVRAPKRLGLVSMKPRLRSLILVSNNARIGRPRRRVKGIDEVIKVEQLKTRLFDEFDKAPGWKVATVIGKEGLAAFARDLVALHRPIAFDWPARFGLNPTPAIARLHDAPRPVVSPPGQKRAPQANRWLVKYDGPCSTCGKVLVKDTPAVWSQAVRKMFCPECGGRAT
jgi:DNA-directed RNA polymerase subunit RPC12/RpoP